VINYELLYPLYLLTDLLVHRRRLAEVTGEKEEKKAHDERVSEVEERADESFNLKLGSIEVDTIDEEVDCCESTCHE